MAADTDDFAGTGSLIGWSGDTGSYDRLSGVGRATTAGFVQIIRTAARAAVDQEMRLDWINGSNSDHYQENNVRVQSLSSTTATTTHYVLYATESGGEWGVQRVRNGSGATAFATGSMPSIANNTVTAIIRVTAHPVSGNPVINAWIGATQVLTDYEDTHVDKITTGLYTGIINYQQVSFDNYWADDVVTAVPGAGYRLTMAGDKTLTMLGDNVTLMGGAPATVTFTGAWGGLTAVATATPNHPATLAGSWGGLTGSVTALPTVTATLAGSWGGLTGAMAAGREVPATLSGSWGGLSGSITALPTVPATFSGAWGALSGSVTAGVVHDVALSGPWGALVGSMTASVPGVNAVLSGAWGGLTGTATAWVNTAAVILDEGFEGGTLPGAFTAVGTSGFTGDAVTLLSSGAYEGTYCAQFATGTTVNNKFARLQKDLTLVEGVILKLTGRFFLPTGTYAACQGAIQIMGHDPFTAANNMLNNHSRLMWDSSNQTWRMYVKSTATGSAVDTNLTANPGFTIPENQWVTIVIEQRLTTNAAMGYTKVWLNGTLVGSGTGANLYDTGGNGITRARDGLVAEAGTIQTNALAIRGDKFRIETLAAPTADDVIFTGAWGGLTGSITALPTVSATLAGSWGGLAGSIAAGVTQSAVLAASWGGLTGSIVAIPNHAAVLAGSWGGLTGSMTATPALLPYNVSGNWGLSFQDEFTGTSLDTMKWADSWFNQSTMNNVTTHRANVSVAGGCAELVLASTSSGALINTNPNDMQYWSPPGNTPFTMTYGYVEARIHFPGSGTDVYNWPAIWLNGQRNPLDGEHDFAEGLQTMSVVYHSPSGSHPQGTVAGTWTDDFHIYGIHRYPGGAKVYYDGTLVKTYTTDDSGAPLYIIINVGYSGSRTLATGTASKVRVDYVRAWTDLNAVGFYGYWGGLTGSITATNVSGAVFTGNWGGLAATATAAVTHDAVATGAWGGLTGAITALPTVAATLNGNWGALNGSMVASVNQGAIFLGNWGALSGSATATVAHGATLAGNWGGLTGAIVVGWPRPRSTTAVGPRYTYDSVDSTTTSLPPGIYSKIQYTNQVSIQSVGTYEFHDCQIFPVTETGIISGRTVYMDHCRTGGYAGNGGFTGYTLEWCHVEFDGVCSWRPAGSPDYYVTTPTPMAIRSSWVVARGPLPDGPHRDALQCLGGNGYEFKGTWFHTEPEYETGGSSSVTAPVNCLAANSLFEDCGVGPYGSAVYMVYGDGPNLQFNNCVVGTIDAPDSIRDLVESDFYPGTNTGFRPLLNGDVIYSTDVSATMSGSWGALTGVMVASVPEPTTFTGAWGALAGSATAVVSHSVTATGTWGSLVGTVAATPTHDVSMQGAWGALAGSMLATTAGGALMVGAWGALAASATATVGHDVTAQGVWGGLTGSMTATTAGGALFIGNWGALGGSVTAGVVHDVVAAGAWGGLAANVSATVAHPVTASGDWGGWTANVAAAIVRPATMVGAWGGWTAVAFAAPERSAVLQGAWGGMVGTATAGVDHVVIASATWSGLAGAAAATVTHAATASGTWGGWSGQVTAKVTVLATATGAWGRLVGSMTVDAPLQGTTATGSIRVVYQATGTINVVYPAQGVVRAATDEPLVV